MESCQEPGLKVVAVLQSTGGNKVQAARLLGIARRTLRLRLRELDLSVTKSVEGDEDDTIAPE